MGKCLNCDFILTKRQNKYCSNHCQCEHQYSEWIKRWKSGNESGLRGSYGIGNHLKRYLLEKYKYKCSSCGWGEINPYTSKIPLEVEHIDGNHLNNNEDILTILWSSHPIWVLCLA